MIYYLISSIIFLSYGLLISAITFGWWQLKVYRTTALPPIIKVSVVVSMRNEALNINSLLHCLLNQNYPSHLYEIILVDDHSTDSSVSIAAEIISKNNDKSRIRLLSLDKEDFFGKKAALNHGIKASTGELIIITDADCSFGKQWILAIASFYASYKPKIILGPVSMTNDGSFLGKLQSLEFISLLSSAAGSCNAGFPLLANGANIAFPRLAYESCGGFSGHLHLPSGDDMFLMLSIKKRFGAEAIRFLRSEDAIVNTPASLELSSFVQQRIRWVSKSRGYKDPLLVLTSFVVFLTNVWLIAIGLAALFSPLFSPLFLALYLIKIVVDFPLMLSYSQFQRTASLVWLFPIMELLNAVYTLFIGIAGNIVKFEWKGRKWPTKFTKVKS